MRIVNMLPKEQYNLLASNAPVRGVSYAVAIKYRAECDTQDIEYSDFTRASTLFGVLLSNPPLGVIRVELWELSGHSNKLLQRREVNV